MRYGMSAPVGVVLATFIAFGLRVFQLDAASATVASFYFMVSWLRTHFSPSVRRPHSATWFTLSTIVAFYSFYFAAFASLSQALYFALRRRTLEVHIKRVGMVIGGLTLVLGPWVVFRFPRLSVYAQHGLRDNVPLDWWNTLAARTQDHLPAGVARIITDSIQAFTIGQDIGPSLAALGLALVALLAMLALWQHKNKSRLVPWPL